MKCMMRKVYQEIYDFKPNIVICHHQNDYEYYKNYFLDAKLLDYKPDFYHIPHCIDRTIFKDYGYKKKYDITFSGALGNSILGNHYPVRQRLLKIAMIFSKKYPQYKLKIHRHPGYDLPDAYTNKYAVELAKIYNESKICITCSGTPKTRFAKYVEIPASNSVIIGDVPDEKDDLNDFNNFMISIKETDTDQDIMDKLLYYLRNEDKLNELKIKGHKWSQKYTQEHYSIRFLTILNTYLENNQNKDKWINSTDSTNNNIGCLWIGNLLDLEMASLKSFLKLDMVDLYLYDKT